MQLIGDIKEGGISFRVFAGEVRAMASNAVVISDSNEMVLVDALLIPSDAQKLVEAIKASGKVLSTVLITHAHPDHYFGLPVVQEAFPNAHIFARRTTIEFLKEFQAKTIHWQEMYPGEIPNSLQLPKLLEVDTLKIGEHKIKIVDNEMVETIQATAFYVPDAKTFVVADLIYSKSHHYMSDVGRADTWIEAIDKARKVGDVNHVIPGHGPVGGPELFEESIEWMETYLKVAKPGVRFTEIAKAMMEQYPNHGLSMLLWVTRGPGFGLAGGKEIGAPSGFNSPDY
ncbi:MAG: MBL fold metallo-hydrolase [Acidobacteriota bacterium]